MNDWETTGGDAETPVTLGQVEELLAERLDVEALAQMVEHLDYANKVSGKLTSAFGGVRGQIEWQRRMLGAVQQEVRDLIQDVALLKRALASLGHVGVMERRKIERELVHELFPPTQPRPGAGVAVNVSQSKPPQRVDCENRLHLCKAACCRIFNAHLTPSEVDQDTYDWDPRQPYALRKNRHGCVHLTSGACSCMVYESRPNICRNYSCAGDKRIWQDFEKMILNPELAKRLETLSVNTKPAYGDAPALSENRNGPVETNSASAIAGKKTGPPSVSPVLEAAVAAVAPKPKVAPPNFDDLRKLVVPRPANRFVPPDAKKVDQEDGHSDGCVEQEA